jgi:hypothetical protein
MMTKSDVLKMAVELTAGELAGPMAVGLMVNGPSAVEQRIRDHAQLVVNTAHSMDITIEDD